MSMTDEQIVKALECCASGTGCDTCRRCPFYEDKLCDKDRFALEKHLLDLIRRQQEEIENLKADKEAIINGQLTLQKMYLESRDKAVRELAEIIVADYPELEYYLDNLVREMTEEEGGKG